MRGGNTPGWLGRPGWIGAFVIIGTVGCADAKESDSVGGETDGNDGSTSQASETGGGDDATDDDAGTGGGSQSGDSADDGTDDDGGDTSASAGETSSGETGGGATSTSGGSATGGATSNTGGGSQSGGSGGDPEPYGECGPDCGAPNVCHEPLFTPLSWCAPSCFSDFECPDGPPGAGLKLCYFGPGGLGQCAIRCTNTGDCPQGMECFAATWTWLCGWP